MAVALVLTYLAVAATLVAADFTLTGRPSGWRELSVTVLTWALWPIVALYLVFVAGERGGER